VKSETDTQDSSKPQVIAFPARTPLIGGRQIHYLFSVRQVVDVLKHIDVQSINGSKDSALGMTNWRGRLVPVLNLEKRLGLRISENGMPLRNVVIRSVEDNGNADVRDLFVVCSMGASSRQFQLPLACRPVLPPAQLPGIDYIDGMYVMAEYLFMVLSFGKMINGMTPDIPREAVYGQ